MKTHLREKLDLEDNETLFSQGACHVFADELYARLAPFGFRLRRLADVNRTNVRFEALHVCGGKGDTIVDVDGARKENDVVREWIDFRRRHSTAVPNYQFFECSREELFSPVQRGNDSEQGIGNRWHYIVDEEFVAECRKRASGLIERFPEKYLVALEND